jgi:transcription antitermination factor NusG
MDFIVDSRALLLCRTAEPTTGLDSSPSPTSLRGTVEQPNSRTAERSSLHWYVLWTKSHCEPQVCDQLAPQGFELFLPMMDVWSRRNGMRYHSAVPMFPGYVFLHHAMDEVSYIAVRKARGLVSVLGRSWDRPAVVPDREIEAIRKVHDARVPVLPHPYLREGQRVRLTAGLLAGAEGVLLRTKPNKGLLVVSIGLLQRSVAVEVDTTLVEPV